MKIMQNRKKTTDPCSIGVLLFESFSNHCLANAIEPLRAANRLAAQTLYQWDFVSLDGQGVTSSSGLPVTPKSSLSRHSGGEYLFLMPSYGALEQDTALCKRSLRAAGQRFDVLVGMDMGSWLLASAGMLDGVTATIHWDEFARFSETFPDVRAVPDPIVIHDSIQTCGGAMTAFDLVLDLIASHHGRIFATEIRGLFSIAEQRSNQSLSLTVGRGEKRPDEIFSIMKQCIETPIPISDIASRLGISQKQLEKECLKRFQVPPRSLYRKVRLWEVKRLLLNSRYSVVEIAQRCGYQDPSAMTRAFREEFGVTPRQVRSR